MSSAESDSDGTKRRPTKEIESGNLDQISITEATHAHSPLRLFSLRLSPHVFETDTGGEGAVLLQSRFDNP